MNESPEQWMLDLNNRHHATVGVVTILSTISMALPIFFLKNIVNINSGRSLLDSLSWWAIIGWAMLALSIVCALVYYYHSAKWIRLAWGRDADICGFNVGKRFVEAVLDYSYFLMMVGFASGVICILAFMMTFHQYIEA